MQQLKVNNFYLIVLLILFGISTSSIANPFSELSKSVGHIKRVHKTYITDTLNVGTGFMISSDGYILTNYHVIEGYTSNTDVQEYYHMTISFDGRTEYIVTEYYSHPDYDVSLLKIDVENKPYIDLSNSNKNPSLGDTIYSIGYPLKVGKVLTSGVISGLNMSSDIDTMKYIISDIVINRGNSGGPIFDSNGNFVGISTMIYTNSNGFYVGYSFIMPYDMVQYVTHQLMVNGKIERSSFGVVLHDLMPLVNDKTIRYQNGSKIRTIKPNSAAYKGGLLENDIILSLNGESIKRSSDISYLLLKTKPYDVIRLGISRNGLLMEKQVVLHERVKEKEIKIESVK